MKNKKGFTLVELLAVIVILGVLLLIAVPAVSSIIENSKRGAAKDEAMEALDAVYNCSLPGSTVCDATTAATYLQNAGTLNYTTVSGTSTTDPEFSAFTYKDKSNTYTITISGNVTLTNLKNALGAASFSSGTTLTCTTSGTPATTTCAAS